MIKHVTRCESILLPCAASVVLIGGWALAVQTSGTTVFPSPAQVVRGIVQLAREGVLVAYMADSLWRVGAGFTLALLVGVPLGLGMGLSPAATAILNPVVQLLRPISPLAWIPIAILVFGVSNLATIFLIFLTSALPLAVSAMNATRQVPEIYVRAGRNFGLSRLALLRRVIVPAARADLLTGIRISLGVAWLVLVAAEMIAVDSGLGYLIIDARNAGKRYDLVVAGMALIGGVGLLLDAGVRWCEQLEGKGVSRAADSLRVLARHHQRRAPDAEYRLGGGLQ
jgi:NitT/TauT family transport system permease protein